VIATRLTAMVINIQLNPWASSMPISKGCWQRTWRTFPSSKYGDNLHQLKWTEVMHKKWQRTILRREVLGRTIPRRSAWETDGESGQRYVDGPGLQYKYSLTFQCLLCEDRGKYDVLLALSGWEMPSGKSGISFPGRNK
jgi:hypothetical protein